MNPSKWVAAEADGLCLHCHSISRLNTAHCPFSSISAFSDTIALCAFLIRSGFRFASCGFSAGMASQRLQEYTADVWDAHQRQAAGWVVRFRRQVMRF